MRLPFHHGPAVRGTVRAIVARWAAVAAVFRNAGRNAGRHGRAPTIPCPEDWQDEFAPVSSGCPHPSTPWIHGAMDPRPSMYICHTAYSSLQTRREHPRGRLGSVSEATVALRCAVASGLHTEVEKRSILRSQPALAPLFEYLGEPLGEPCGVLKTVPSFHITVIRRAVATFAALTTHPSSPLAHHT
ncbi:hypothetical protein P154DRAFT_572071 [Amniculicola lignicola CBS 123094]|uniref:Uncharacterized protein n=1 Tax=Amniculicola lignicola CBS 123094 TaxID=1392246 RepID=A0A6A5WRC8_9PLEO|nr:hypothetical protein P154DRAFT_572071 [Amniculicola lignicola CBS 123094]